LPMDIRIAADTAKFGLFFVRMGIVPELAASSFLPRIVGLSRAMDWCTTARLIPAAEALEAGLVSAVVSPDELLDRAVKLGEACAKWPSSAQVATRKLLQRNSVSSNIGAVAQDEVDTLARGYQTWEHKEAVSAFMEKRDPDFTR